MGFGSFNSDGFDKEANKRKASKSTQKTDNQKKEKEPSDDDGLKVKSVSSSTYYRMEKRYPYLSVETEDGELVRHIHPYTTPITFVKREEDDDWERLETPDCIVEIWWEQMSLKNHAQKVRRVHDKDLYRLLRDDPSTALSLLKEAKRKAKKPQKPSTDRRCYICGKRHKNLSGDYQTIHKKAVCNTHTIKEIKEADLM